VRDDRLPSKQAARRAPPNSAVASAACLEGPGARYSICGCIKRPAFPAPSDLLGEWFWEKLGRIAPRECGVTFDVIARSDLSAVAQRAKAEATKQSTLLCCGATMDCFAEPVIGRAFARDPLPRNDAPMPEWAGR